MDDFAAALMEISRNAFADEALCVQHLLGRLEALAPRATAIRERAERYVETLRRGEKMGPLEAFLHEYSLSSQEGVMVMCLAEALLRIPDSATADALIHDKLASGDWDRHIGFGRPWLVTLGGYGLDLADKVSDERLLRRSAGEFVGALAHRLGEPVVRAALRQAMKLLGGVFVFAETVAEAKQKARAAHHRGQVFSFDMLGEGARSAAQAEHYFDAYLQAIVTLAEPQSATALPDRDGISVKLSALHPRFELRKWETLERELLPKLKTLLAEAAHRGVPVTLDAEEASRLDVTLRVVTALFTDASLARDAGLGVAVQAYQKRAPGVIAYLQSLAAKTGCRMPVRLVKGAYWDGEIKRAQADGLPFYPVFTRKAHSDVSYLACAAQLLASPDCFYPQFATHNALTVAAILEMGGDAEFEFQRLHGMGEALYRIVLEDTPRHCRVYAPVGVPGSLLSYLIRRILENGANSSFVRGLHDAPIESLLRDPVQASAAAAGSAAETIRLPRDLYADRTNSPGYDFGYACMQQEVWQALRPPVTKAPGEATAADCAAAFARAAGAWDGWRNTPVAERAALLERLAVLYGEHEAELLSLLVYEAGKTVADAVAEWREAVDYCRYYAQEARRIFAPQPLQGASGESNMLLLQPRGTVVAISPWNFPLAIFTGQITAALVTGNCVLAKPSEETPRIAARAVELMHEAGIPAGALQLLPGRGETVGEALVGDVRADAVVFTGSTATARAINKALAARDAPIAALIAETGGQNCMIVDSSALIEQTVDDMIVSAFGSAGQRCSSLRVAFVQDDIADALLQVLAGAMMELRVGPPADPATDIGPVISREAQASLLAHIDAMKRGAKLIAASPPASPVEGMFFVPPHAFEIGSIAALKGEIFGPVLHVVRYRERSLDAVIAQINSTGYGLTFGMQSRIDEKIRYVCERVRAGNIYVNRSMIGAVVGVQPFGGRGLSGTGPKAGGPHYLPRFCSEQTISINSAAVGGNLELLT